MSDHHGAERRHYFRIEDEVHLEYRRLSDAEYATIQAMPEAEREGSCSLVAQLRGLTTQANNLLVNIRKNQPDIAQYLALMDKKMELISRQLAGQQSQSLQADTPVNISAGGIGFPCAEALEPGTPLELSITFLPSMLCIRAYGRSAHCDDHHSTDPARPYCIGVEFTLISEMEQDALMRHILARQSEMLRRAREHEEQ